VNSTVQYAMRALSGRAALAAMISPSVAVLSQATLRTVLMTRITLAAALVGTGVAVTVVTIPMFRPSLSAGSQAASTYKGLPGDQEKRRTVEQDMFLARDLEDALYKLLKRDHEFNEPRWPFVIKVRDVQDKRLIDATFKHRTKGLVNEYDAIIQAKRAVLRFDLDAKIVRVFLEDSEVQNFARDTDIVLIKNRVLEIPIPAVHSLIVDQNPPRRAGAPIEVRMPRMDSDQTLSLVYSSDGKMLATAGFDGAVHLWDMIEAKEVATLKGANSTIRAVAFSSDGKALACVNDTGDAKIWDVATGTLTKSLPGLSEPMREARGKLSAIAFAPDGELLAIAGQAQFKAGTLGYIYEVRILEVQSGQSRWSHMGRGEGAMSLAFSPDGEVLASAGWRSVKLWNSQTGEPVRNLSPTRGGIYSAAFTPDGRTLLGGGIVGPASPDGQQPAGTITLWDVGQGRILNTLEGQTRHVRVLAIAHNGKTVASGGWGPIRTFGNEQRIVSEVRLWDIGTGRLIWTFEGKSGEIGSLAFALDGNTLVYCDHDAVGVINVETGKLERTLTKTTRTPSKP
jgi:WD40 repeat protein